MSNKLCTHIRWCIRRDIPEVIAIENATSQNPWTEDDFFRCLRERNTIAMIAERDGALVGFMVYTLNKKFLEIIRLSVHPGFQRARVGTAMINKLIGKLETLRRPVIQTTLRETNLTAQIFLRAHGFKATRILRGHYHDTNEDAFKFSYTLTE